MALAIYRETQERIGYGSISLERRGDYAVVCVFTRRGRRVPVMAEHLDGQFSQCVTELGIADALEGKAEFKGLLQIGKANRRERAVADVLERKRAKKRGR